MARASEQQTESQEHKKDTQGKPNGAGPGSSGSGNIRVRSNTPENRQGELNPSAPTEATEGPSTNLANHPSDAAGSGTTGRPARGENKNEGKIKKPSAEKHEAA